MNDDEGPPCKFIKLGNLECGDTSMASKIPGICEGEGTITTGKEDNLSIRGNLPYLDEISENDIELYSNTAYNLSRNSSGTYVSDVIGCGSFFECVKLCESLYDESSISYKRGLLIISIHNNHVHIVHDCAYSNKSCRCSFIQKAEIQLGLRRRGRVLRRRPFCNQLEISDFKNVHAYFGEETRRIYYLRSGRQVERLPPKYTRMAFSGSERDRAKGPLETCTEVDEVELLGREYRSNESIGGPRRCDEALSQKKRNQREKKGQKILKLLQTHICSPVKALLNLDVWLKHPIFEFWDESDKLVAKVISNWEKQLCMWSIYDFQKLYINSNTKCYFGAGPNDFNSYYYNTEESLDIILQLLQFQFSNDEEIICNFVTDLYNVCEKILPKLNCLLIYSPPSAGKNFFFDCVKDFYINSGKIQNAINKHNNFALQDICQRRIVYWNEPNYESSKEETFKEILGGDSTNTPIKYKGEGIVHRTPFLISTNHHLSIMTNPAFKDRITQYSWSTCPMLKGYNKKPNPLCIYFLFKKYGLVHDDILNKE